MIKSNLANLEDLWNWGGRQQRGFQIASDFRFAVTEGSEWPNRIWLKAPLTAAVLVRLRREIPPDTSPTLSLFRKTDWRLFDRDDRLDHSEQVGMSLTSTVPFPVPSRITLAPATAPKLAAAWADGFSSAFGYRIPASVVERGNDATVFYLAQDGERTVGTILLHYTEEGAVAGIHSVGILPEYRRKGYAREVMHAGLNKAMSRGAKLSVLQASAMGLGLYQQLGYREDFRMRTYRLHN